MLFNYTQGGARHPCLFFKENKKADRDRSAFSFICLEYIWKPVMAACVCIVIIYMDMLI
jgi:hypothetical protein